MKLGGKIKHKSKTKRKENKRKLIKQNIENYRYKKLGSNSVFSNKKLLILLLNSGRLFAFLKVFGK